MSRPVPLSFAALALAAVTLGACGPRPPVAGGLEQISFEGIRFSYSPVLAAAVRAERVPASPELQDPEAKLEGVPVAHLAFTFLGSEEEDPYASYWAPARLQVYPLAAYEAVLTRSGGYAYAKEAVRVLHDLVAGSSAEALRQDLAGRPTEGEVPFLPLLDATQAFHAHLTRVPFENGAGVLFLTQYNIETAPVNNRGLAYVFQGLTRDGRYAVSAAFPVTAPFLPPGFDAADAGAYDLPPDLLLLPSDSDAYRAYLEGVAGRLEALPPSGFAPDLGLIEALVRSLRVEPAL